MLRREFGLLVVLGAALALVGCGGGGEPPAPSDGDQEAPQTAITGGGTISGVINFSGTAPENEPILMDAEPICAEQYPDGAFQETVVVNSNGTLQDVFVYVKQGLPDQEWPVSSEGVLLDQSGCRYHPHVLGIQSGQTLIIRNSDGILHNIHPMPVNNRPFNLGQPVEMDSEKSFSTPEVMIPVECDVHDWMLGYIGVLSHPFFAVSGSDGSFSISGLPAGDYVVEAWHELYGTQTISVSVAEGGTEQIEFSYSGS
ncbi:MAG TPA: carboxypeptidase regulatory-like domain-containing protein [Anaerolineales bacterium]